jgi:hypothetical protein
MSDGWDDTDRVAWGHVFFNGSGNIAIPFIGEFYLVPVDLEQLADRNGAPAQAGPRGGRLCCLLFGFWPRAAKAAVMGHLGEGRPSSWAIRERLTGERPTHRGSSPLGSPAAAVRPTSDRVPRLK